jgi:flagellar biosynthesis chaperone FliJ
MNITEVRNVVRLVIAEAMEKGGLPKSGGKLVHLKKELAGLKKMKESLGSYTINEGGDGSFVAEYAHMQKFVTELEKIKMAHAKLSEMLDNQISEVEGKVSSETEKVKEIMGLIEKAKKPAVKKADKKADKKDDKKEEPKADEKKEKKKVEKKESKLQENEEAGLNDILSKEELINKLNNAFSDESINSLSFFQKVALAAVKKQIVSKINAGKIQTRADLKAALQNP